MTMSTKRMNDRVRRYASEPMKSGRSETARRGGATARGASARRAGSPRDPERTRQALLDAALTEFAEKGLAGARVSEIARRAGVNKQLISYHFDGKQGLYDALAERWLASEREFADPDLPLGELVAGYARATVEQRELT